MRGPYPRPRDVTAESRLVAREPVTLEGVDHFLKSGQHTIYLRARCRNLHRVWAKSAEFEFAPHVTVFDGPSRRDAVELYQIVTRFPIRAQFVSAGLEPLVSNGGQLGLSLYEALDFDILREIARTPLDFERLVSLDYRFRAQIAERICRYLAMQAGPSEGVVAAPKTIGLPSGWATVRQPRGIPRLDSPEPSRKSRYRPPGFSDSTDPWETWEFLRPPK
ncbi:MAG: hypothetical protein M3321_11305 [Actinomycetota bacterium]|nr:hypothetical protein [Actinomycetota bacterium]